MALYHDLATNTLHRGQNREEQTLNPRKTLKPKILNPKPKKNPKPPPKNQKPRKNIFNGRILEIEGLPDLRRGGQGLGGLGV